MNGKYDIIDCIQPECGQSAPEGQQQPVVSFQGVSMKNGDSDWNELYNYANLDGTELGEYVHTLISVSDCSQSYGMSPEFESMLYQEMSRLLNRFRTESKIVKRLEPRPPREYEVLEWIEN